MGCEPFTVFSQIPSFYRGLNQELIFLIQMEDQDSMNILGIGAWWLQPLFFMVSLPSKFQATFEVSQFVFNAFLPKISFPFFFL